MTYWALQDKFEVDVKLLYNMRGEYKPYTLRSTRLLTVKAGTQLARVIFVQETNLNMDNKAKEIVQHIDIGNQSELTSFRTNKYDTYVNHNANLAELVTWSEKL